MALTKPIQDVLEGNPVSATYQPIASELTTLLTELATDDGSNPKIVAGCIQANDDATASGYVAGSGGVVTQATSRTTGVTLNKPCGGVELFTAAGSATPAVFTVTNSLVGAGDVINCSQRGGSNSYVFFTKAATGSFTVLFWSAIGTASDSPTMNFAIQTAQQT